MPITPNHWGPHKWISVHVTCYFVDIMHGTDLVKQEALHNWMKLSAGMLPCSICEKHFQTYMEVNPLPEVKAYEAGETPYLRWSIQAHNDVRKRQGKTVADEDVVVLTYKSGRIFGLDKDNMIASQLSVENVSLSQDTESSELQSYKITTYVLCAILGIAVLAVVIYLLAKSKRFRPIPELSE